MIATLARRVTALETTVRAGEQRRWDAAVERIRATMAPEHASMVAAWLGEHVDGKAIGRHVESPDHVCPRCIDRLDPPALARAVWFMLLDHTLGSGTPVAMPPDVAEIYLNDPQAYPAAPCEGCGYLMPMRSRIRPDGTYRHIAPYVGVCPVCDRDDHPEEDETP